MPGRAGLIDGTNRGTYILDRGGGGGGGVGVTIFLVLESNKKKKKIIFRALARDLGSERARVAIRKHARAISRLPLLPELAIERLII